MGRNKAPEFETFWKAYPVHNDKPGAERAWNHLSASDKSKAVAGIPAYRERCLRTGVYICYGQGYLNRRRWEDEPTQKPAVCQDENTGGALEGMETW